MNQLKAYIAAPFSSMTEKPTAGRFYGELKDAKYIHLLEEIESAVRDCGYETHLPHRDINNWGRIYLQPAETARRCYEAIFSCDVFIAYPRRSRGVHVELGWASSLGKRVILLLDADEKPGLIESGLHAVCRTEILEFGSVDELRKRLKSTLGRG